MSDNSLNKNVSPSKEEQKRQYELRIKKQRRREVITVLAILSSVFIVAILLALLKGGERMVQDFTGSSMAQARKIYENTRNTLIGMGIISSVIMIIFIVQTIKDRKNRKHKGMERKAFIDYDRLEMARRRVEKARMEAKKDNDNEYIKSRRLKLHEGMTEEEYRKYRQEEYEKYMNMDFDETDEKWLDEIYEEELNYENEKLSIFDRIKYFIVEHCLLIGIITGVIIIAIVGVIILL